jgi:hypothetical protein
MLSILAALFVTIAVSLTLGTPSASAQTQCMTTADNGVCGPYGAYAVNNNVWNPISGQTDTLTATSENAWSVVAVVPNQTPKAVTAYPEVQENYASIPVSSLTTVQQNFDVSHVPSKQGVGAWEIAADDWLNGTPGNEPNGAIEIMVWYDVDQTSPAGSNTGKTLTVGNRTFDLWASAPAGSADNTLSLVSQETVTSGTVNFVDYLNFLEGLGYVTGTDTLQQLNFGEEILQTNDADATFTFSSYNNVVDS